MSYKEKPQIKLYKYENSNFVYQAIIDDYLECSFENNRFQAGQFSITINYNIPNALLFERGLFVQFGNNPYNFGEILNVSDSIGSDGKGSQVRLITGYDIRYIFKRRIIKNLNNNDTWAMTAKGELCMRNLIQDQCGINAEVKRRLPVINTIPSSENAIGSEYSVSESFSNLYDVLTTIATQTEIGWRINFNGETLTLEFYSGEDKHTTVRFDTDYESLNEGQFTDSSSSFANAIFVGGKGTGSERDIYEGENAIEGNSPSGLDRFEAWDNQSEMTTEEDYAAEALSMLSQYGQTLQVSGKGLAKCPYEYGEEYEVGDIITIAFSGKSAIVQILSVTEHWAFGNYNLDFEFGKPQPDLNQQLQLLLRQIQKASSKTNSTESVKWYTIPTDSEMPSSDVTFNTIGFTGTLSQNRTFTFYLDDEKTGAKNYTVYAKNLSGNYILTLTTATVGRSNVVLKGGTNVVARILIDEDGNVINQGMTATSTIESGNNQPVTSDAVASSIQQLTDIASSLPTDAVLHYSFDEVPDYPDGTADIRLLNNNTYDLQSTNYRLRNNGGTTFSDNNGNVQVAITAGATDFAYGAFINNDYISNKIVKLRIKVTAINGTMTINSSSDNIVKTITDVGVYDFVELHNSTATYPSLYFFCRTANNSCTFTVEQIYIGDGSYSTPIIDNANGQNNATNNGGIAIKGVSGKGAYFLNGKYANGNFPFNFGNDFSMVVWVKPDNNTNDLMGQIVVFTNSLYLVNGSSAGGAYNVLYLTLRYTDNTYLTVYYNSLLTANEWSFITLSKSGNTLKTYKNGQLINTTNLEKILTQSTGAFTLSNSANTRPQSVDDLLIFNRALSAEEVQALYLNKANTPKYYNVNNYKLPSPPSTDGTYNLQCTISSGLATYSWVGSGNRSLPETKGGDEETDEEKPIEEEPKEEER